MYAPIHRFAVLSLTVALGCRGADAARGGSAAAPAASSEATPAATAAAAHAPHAMPTDSISERADRGRIRGNPKASLWIIEASDFQCPFCKMWHDSTYGALTHNYVDNGRARLAYLNFPLSQHQNALPAAEAAMCASVQDKFWPMHDSLFASQERWETLPNAVPYFDSAAAHMGVSMPAWRDCVARHLTRPLIEADYERSRTAGVKSTPTFFVGDQQLSGFQPYSFFRQVVEAQLAKQGAPR
ncbi:MAG: DsbA family protein [Gemmatimonadaceae bacterium]